MLCAISGEAPQQPVASRKSGNVFEKRLIEAYIADHGTDPVTGEDLSVDDLIDLKTARIVKPRPPTLTSVPSLLSAFQNEWDAIVLETFTLKKELAKTRQELSTALYQFEGALRLIAKLNVERDEARAALSNIGVSGGVAEQNGESMQMDGKELPENLAAKVENTSNALSKTRKKRVIPDDWAKPDVVQSFDAAEIPDASLPGSRVLALDTSGNLALLGGTDGVAVLYSLAQKQTLQTLKFGDGSITAALFWEQKPVVATSTGAIKIFENGDVMGEMIVHAGAATDISLHPSGDILASVGEDKSIVFYDLTTMKQAARIFTQSELTCGQFHPDGMLFICGGTSSTSLLVYNVKTGESVATLDTSAPVRNISFSENGLWVAYVPTNSTTVSILNLRNSKTVHTADIGSEVRKAAWDHSGQYLAIAGAGCVVVEHYDKATKSWSEPLRKAVNTADVKWGPNATSLIALNTDGALVALG